jgi:hypothetical protein
MKIHYDVEVIADEMRAALDQIAERHGLQAYWHPLMVCVAVEVMASPMKALAGQNRIGLAVAQRGVNLYRVCRLMKAVERIKSPDSQQINFMMDAVVIALASKKAALTQEILHRDALRIFLGRPKLTLQTANGGKAEITRLRPSFMRSLEYLTEGEVIENTDDGWALRYGLGF